MLNRANKIRMTLQLIDLVGSVYRVAVIIKREALRITTMDAVENAS